MSILLVWMGSGILLIHCCHAETSKISNVSEVCKDQCAPMSDCMQAKVITLSPVNNAFTASFDFQAPIINLASFQLPKLPEFKRIVNSSLEHISQRWFNHPREYLSFIRILII